MPKKRVSVTFTKPYIEAIDHLIKGGVYVNQTELIKDALRRLFRHFEIRIYEDA